MEQKYGKWSADTTTLEIRFDDDPSPVIELDQQEQEVGSWKILPLHVLCSSGEYIIVLSFSIQSHL